MCAGSLCRDTFHDVRCSRETALRDDLVAHGGCRGPIRGQLQELTTGASQCFGSQRRERHDFGHAELRAPQQLRALVEEHARDLLDLPPRERERTQTVESADLLEQRRDRAARVAVVPPAANSRSIASALSRAPTRPNSVTRWPRSRSLRARVVVGLSCPETSGQMKPM
jgi:hypothetical protein